MPTLIPPTVRPDWVRHHPLFLTATTHTPQTRDHNPGTQLCERLIFSAPRWKGTNHIPNLKIVEESLLQGVRHKVLQHKFSRDNTQVLSRHTDSGFGHTVLGATGVCLHDIGHITPIPVIPISRPRTCLKVASYGPEH